jgi:TRAP-type C4-dicarboxylate transport system permease small subunit
MSRATELVTALLLALTILVALLQVVFRYGVGASLSWSEELARYLFIWVIFLGTASAARRGEHMAVEAITNILPVALLRPLAMLILAISIVFFGVVFYTGILLTGNAVRQLSTALEISVAYVYISAPIGAALTIVHLVNGLVQIVATEAAPPHTAADIS